MLSPRYLTALLGSVALTAMAAGPALAADPIAQAGANAITISVSGDGFSSGATVATHDGDSETKVGEVTPPISVLAGQDLLNAGVLAQDATAAVNGNGLGSSAACSGVAGDGATIAEVGDSNCLTPGANVGLSIANLDLTGTTVIDPASALGPLGALATPVFNTLVADLSADLSAGLAPLGDTGLNGTFGAIQSRCTAGPGNATTGTANIADARLDLTIGTTTVGLVNFPASPPPNTKVLTDLDVVLNTLLDALRVDLNTTLDGAGGPVGQAIIDPVQAQIVDAIIADVADELAPLEDNILEATLNKQTFPAAGVINVTALELRLLPGAEQFTGSAAVEVDIANVSCGPSGRVTDEPTPTSNPGGGNSGGGGGSTPVPTFVDAGAAQTGNELNGGLAGAALMLGAGLVGVAAYRRVANR